MEPGDRVATFAWNTQRHLEVYLAAPCMGAVLHTLNIRLFPEQLQLHRQARRRTRCCSSTARCCECSGRRAERRRSTATSSSRDEYEQLLAEQPAGPFEYPELDDRAAAGLCYTSGTTGNPKGVLYSHRSNVLHAMGKCLADAWRSGTATRDAGRPDVPRQRLGLPLRVRDGRARSSCPSRFVAAEPLAGLIERERVTIAGARADVWLDLLRYADEHGRDLSSLRTVVCGGSAVPRR